MDAIIHAMPENAQFPNNLRSYREAAGLSQPELAKLANTNVQNISRLERGDRQLTKKWADLLAPALKVEPQWLLFAPPEPEQDDANARKGTPIPPGRLPYAGTVAAGDWLDTNDFNQDLADHVVPESVPRHPRYPQLEQMAWRVRGTSMDQAGILDGEWLVGASYADYVDKIGELDNGNYVVVERTRYQGAERELTVKEVQFARRGMRLIPRSSDPRHKEFFIPLDEDADSDRETVRILGVVLWVGRDLAPGAK